MAAFRAPGAPSGLPGGVMPPPHHTNSDHSARSATPPMRAPRDFLVGRERQRPAQGESDLVQAVPRRGEMRGEGYRVVGSAGRVAALVLGMLLLAMPARAQCVGNVCTVATAGDLVNALTTIDTAPGTYTVNITANIT